MSQHKNIYNKSSIFWDIMPCRLVKTKQTFENKTSSNECSKHFPDLIIHNNCKQDAIMQREQLGFL
jgi:hypothetical protein